MKVAALFAGIGGIELGLARSGHETVLFCENDPSASAVLKKRFPHVPEDAHHEDVRDLSLPSGVELLTAGFPCQDLSQAGQTKGIKGDQSGLVSHVFRMIDESDVPWVLIENVPFMLQLGRGQAMEYLVRQFEERGYRWAYRVVDSRAFGLPQRRRRVYLLAAKGPSVNPATLLFSENAAEPGRPDHTGRACGFYWTEGTRGLGWAVDAIPTLKGGSGLGIPSPPAIWLPDGKIVTPHLRDAERLQGFPVDWTLPAEAVGRATLRWKLVGNAVSVDAAAWVGEVLTRSQGALPLGSERLVRERSWPTAAWGSKKDGRWTVDVSEWPRREAIPPLDRFLEFEPKPLSRRATSGFFGRLKKSSLRYPDDFASALEAHLATMSDLAEV